MARTVIGLFDNFNQAEAAVRDLESAGIPDNAISIVANDAHGEYARYKQSHPQSDVPAAGKGATAGAGIGLAGGVLLGLGALAIPGLGPLAAAGPLVAGLTGAGAGAATGGIIGALTNAGVPEEHAGYYAEGIRRGGTLVSLRVEDNQINQAIDILNRNGAIDINQRSEMWRRDGYTGFNANSPAYTADQLTREREQVRAATANAAPNLGTTATAGTATLANRPIDAERVHTGRQNEETLPVIEEELRVGKRMVERGGVRVYTHVTERPVEENVQLREEHVTVDRHPVNRPISDADLANLQDRTIEVRETAEEVVVDKQARIVEEVVINKQATERTQTIQDTVRRTDVEVEQLTPGAQHNPNVRGYDAYATDFRNNYTSNFANSGIPYEQYEPAYRYGYDRASRSTDTNAAWNEAEVRRDWETQHPGTWDRYKDAIQYSWNRARGRQ